MLKQPPPLPFKVQPTQSCLPIAGRNQLCKSGTRVQWGQLLDSQFNPQHARILAAICPAAHLLPKLWQSGFRGKPEPRSVLFVTTASLPARLEWLPGLWLCMGQTAWARKAWVKWSAITFSLSLLTAGQVSMQTVHATENFHNETWHDSVMVSRQYAQAETGT